MAQDPTIKSPTIGDLERLVDLWSGLVENQRRFGTTLAIESNQSTVQNWLGEQLVSDGIRIAEVEGRYVGFVTFDLRRDRFQRESTDGVIHHLYVERPFRGRGIGTVLLETAEHQLIDRGADRITLEALAENQSAQDFYFERGYTSHRTTFQKVVNETDISNASTTED